MRYLLRDRKGSSFAETAIVVPVILLVTLALLNLSLAAFAAVNANNAANYGARRGAVAQQAAAGTAYEAALTSISHAPVGQYNVTVQGGGFVGAQIMVRVDWQVPNYMGPLLAMFGGGGGPIQGTSTAVFRQEGW